MMDLLYAGHGIGSTVGHAALWALVGRLVRSGSAAVIAVAGIAVGAWVLWRAAVKGRDVS